MTKATKSPVRNHRSPVAPPGPEPIPASEVRRAKELYQQVKALESQLAEAKAAYEATEQPLIDALKNKRPVAPGAPYIELHVTERRNVKWKEVYIEKLGFEAAREIQERTIPTSYYALLFSAKSSSPNGK